MSVDGRGAFAGPARRSEHQVPLWQGGIHHLGVRLLDGDNEHTLRNTERRGSFAATWWKNDRIAVRRALRVWSVFFRSSISSRNARTKSRWRKSSTANAHRLAPGLFGGEQDQHAQGIAVAGDRRPGSRSAAWRAGCGRTTPAVARARMRALMRRLHRRMRARLHAQRGIGVAGVTEVTVGVKTALVMARLFPPSRRSPRSCI